MTILLLALAVLVVLAIGVALSDRVLAGLAERKATEYVTAPLGHDAQLRVHGTPFLTQALRGRYGDIEVTASGLAIGAMVGVGLHAHLVNALLPLRDLLGRRARELPVEVVHGELLLPYAELSRFSRVPGLRLRYRDGILVASAALPVPGLSQLAQLSGETVASIGDNGAVWLRVRNVSVAGIGLPSLVLNQLVPTLAFPIPLPPLPYGLRIEHLTPTPDGLQVTGSARAVVLRSPARPTG